MKPQPTPPATQAPELPVGHSLEPAALSLSELALHCRTSPDWIALHVQEGLLHGQQVQGQWRFAQATLVRARRMADLERNFDADPFLAALATDLIEEVQQLRQQVHWLTQGQPDSVVDGD